ncbi:hypothetical protein KP79_PYT03750 [Mizuhopecten yessoensis]|uniref:SGNH hydrolase-type esterase domain-containing protein n=1 Tax=Mizuhopecten yessoensis TaxID=6573 RepID=A0A210QBH0_MIZYE|nr:hypothetical protein KP79_PYT03750 [Mizuhopecten yessoensis]
MANVVVIGHSFVKRLDRALKGSWTNLGFHDDPTNIAVSCVGKSGGRLPDVYAREVTDRLRVQIADLVLLQIGGNDLYCARIEDAKDSIVNNFLSIVEWLALGLSVVRIGILQLFYRRSTRHVSVHKYNETVDYVNSALKAKCKTLNSVFSGAIKA